MGRGFKQAVGAAALAAIAGISHAAVNAPSWTVVDIGTLGGPGSYGAAVSDAGFVVGCADLPGGMAHAFLYDGKMHDLGTGGGDPAGSSCALAVNDRGVAAGRSSSGDLVLWSGSSVAPIGVKGTVGGINDLNVVVGSANANGGTRAFVYANGKVTMIGGDATGEATAVNVRGQVAGTLSGRAFLYTDGATQDLGTLGGFSSAKGLDDRGRVVGMSTDANGTPYPFLWSNGTMQAIPGPSGSGAIDIDDAGFVIGSAEGTHGYYLDNGTYTRLDTLPAVVAKGWRHLEPTGVNNRGWIVGTATDGAGNLRAFLLVASRRAATTAVELRGAGMIKRLSSSSP
jgi:probable HAF family extracellular repeat protein